jgi:hypothetical protein
VPRMDRTEISHIAHAEHPIAAPVSEPRLERIVTFLAPCETMLDLGFATLVLVDVAAEA